MGLATKDDNEVAPSEVKSTKEAEQGKAPIAQVQISTPVVAPIVNLNTSSTVQVDDSEYCKLLNDKLNSAAIATTSFDFMKFIASVNAIATIIPDEASRFKATFATNQVSNGASLEGLESSAGQYLGIIEEIHTEFKKWSANFVSTEIDARNDQLSKIAKIKEEKVAEIAKITAELTELTSKEAEINGEIHEKTAILETKNIAFISARSKIEGNLTTLKNNLRKYLA